MPATARSVVVVSDGTGNTAGTPVAPALARYVALIEEVAGVPARTLLLSTEQDPASVLNGLRGEAGAVFLAYTEHGRAAGIQAGATGVPVITGQDVTAIALTASLLIALSRAGRTPQSGRVVIAGEQTLPMLCPLLIAAGVGDITTWNPSDAVAFPLRRIAADADAVLALPAGPGRHAGDDGIDDTAVIVADEVGHSTIPLAGLVRAVADQPADHRCRLPDVEIYLACALALVLATPPDQSWPPRADRVLAEQVADAVTRVRPAPAEHRGPTHPLGDGP